MKADRGMPGVSVTACRDYTPAECRRALEEALAPIGGLDWVTAGMRIAVKVNLVMAKGPEFAATTHPALVCTLCEMLLERGASVTVGDSPGGPFGQPFMGIIYASTGMSAVERTGAQLNRDFTFRTVQAENAVKASTMQVTSWLMDADAVIDFAKLKTPGMMGLSCAAKNMFGSIPGLTKTEYHMQYPSHEDFANALVDIVEFIKPRLCIADAVYGMEGNGPTAGRPRYIGALLASKSAHALDLAAARMIGLDLTDVPTLAAANQRGLVPASADELTLHGDIESFTVKDYDLIEMKDITSVTDNSGLNRIAGAAFTHRPRVEKSECRGCGECSRICPAHAITMVNKLPDIDRSKCIRCFCCQEFCRFGAMKVHRPLVSRILNK